MNYLINNLNYIYFINIINCRHFIINMSNMIIYNEMTIIILFYIIKICSGNNLVYA